MGAGRGVLRVRAEYGAWEYERGRSESGGGGGAGVRPAFGLLGGL